MKNALYIVAGVAIVGAVAVVGWVWTRNGPAAAAPTNAQKQALSPPPPVPLASVPASQSIAADVGNYSRAAVDLVQMGKDIFGSLGGGDSTAATSIDP